VLIELCGGPILRRGMVLTYGGTTKYGRAGPDGAPTHGGYSDAMVVNERFAFKAGIGCYDCLVHQVLPSCKA
jgi:hypothetical protein